MSAVHVFFSLMTHLLVASSCGSACAAAAAKARPFQGSRLALRWATGSVADVIHRMSRPLQTQPRVRATVLGGVGEAVAQPEDARLRNDTRHRRSSVLLAMTLAATLLGLLAGAAEAAA